MNEYLDKTASLTPLSHRVICEKATEYPFSGTYNAPQKQGSYLCRRCGIALFRATAQFHSGCGWPSFDDNIHDNVLEQLDSDGQRHEILCTRCKAHLGHVFRGEHFTHNNRRHCVNSAALDFVTNSSVVDTEEAIVAGGCFWGVDYYLKRLPGVLKVEVGYTGGHILDPSYQQVCGGNSGHYEAVRVVYDKAILSYTAVLKKFFEIHDPTQNNGQGPDIGLQYQSAVFYYNKQQLEAAQRLVDELKARHYLVCTKLLPVSTFWLAEDYHQDYYDRQQKLPYCHRPESRFD